MIARSFQWIWKIFEYVLPIMLNWRGLTMYWNIRTRDFRSINVTYSWWPRHTPRVGMLGLSFFKTAEQIPKSFELHGFPGPGEIMMPSGLIFDLISSIEIESFLYTFGIAPCIPMY